MPSGYRPAARIQPGSLDGRATAREILVFVVLPLSCAALFGAAEFGWIGENPREREAKVAAAKEQGQQQALRQKAADRFASKLGSLGLGALVIEVKATKDRNVRLTIMDRWIDAPAGTRRGAIRSLYLLWLKASVNLHANGSEPMLSIYSADGKSMGYDIGGRVELD